MRVVAFVGVLIACIHAGVWAVSRDVSNAPAFNGQLASVSYTPFDGSAHPDSGRRSTAEQIRADLKAIAPYTRMIRTYSSTGGAELVPEVAREFGLRVSVGAWIDKNTEPQRARNARGDRSRPQAPQRRQRRGRQRDDLSRRANHRRAHQQDPARQARDLGPGHHRRNLERLDRASRARLGRRLHRRPRAALLGRHLRNRRGRPGHPHLRHAAAGLSRQAHRDRRVRLAERRL